jgi:pimeloyl-ACP methyl ester carboxylesterase
MNDDFAEILRIAFPKSNPTNIEYKNSQENSSDSRHIVILIHGIRTQAPWYEKVHLLIKESSSSSLIDVRNVGYQYFDVFRFLNPFHTRNEPIRRVLNSIQSIREDNPSAKLSVVAHSFGTYIFAEILKTSEIEFHRVILCGSIIQSNFEWGKYKNRIDSLKENLLILNDCGTKDIWPILAGCMTYGFGASGTFGFRNPYVRDRFHKLSHGDYFTDEFIHKYWIPYLLCGENLPSDLDLERESPPYWQSILTLIPLWSIIPLTILVIFIYLVVKILF